MTGRPLLLLTTLLSLAGCVTYTQIPLRDGTYPRNAVRVGDEARVETRSGESLSFTVTNVEDGTLTGDGGEQVPPAEMTALEVGRTSKKTTYITLGIVGGILGTAWLLDELEDCDSGLICDWEYE